VDYEKHCIGCLRSPRKPRCGLRRPARRIMCGSSTRTGQGTHGFALPPGRSGTARGMGIRRDIRGRGSNYVSGAAWLETVLFSSPTRACCRPAGFWTFLRRSAPRQLRLQTRLSRVGSLHQVRHRDLYDGSAAPASSDCCGDAGLGPMRVWRLHGFGTELHLCAEGFAEEPGSDPTLPAEASTLCRRITCPDASKRPFNVCAALSGTGSRRNCPDRVTASEIEEKLRFLRRCSAPSDRLLQHPVRRGGCGWPTWQRCLIAGSVAISPRLKILSLVWTGFLILGNGSFRP